MTLDVNAIPQKTAYGQKEITEKLQNISAHLRRALLIVDGKKNFQQLISLAQAFGGKTSFVQLLDAEMIEIIGDTNQDNPSKNTEESNLNIDIREDVIEALKDVYGAGIAKEINKIAEKFPPENHGVDFLNACSKKAMMLMNKNEVDEIFKPIFAKINS